MAGIAVVTLTLIHIFTGSTSLEPSQVWQVLTGSHEAPARVARIVIDIRLVKAITALLAGAALGVSGLEMQTLFRNPLAGPYVLGVSAGASLGVALMMLGGSVLGLSFILPVAAAAWIGAAAVLLLIAMASRRVNDIMVILVLGMMFSSGVSAVVEILQYLSHNEALKSYVVWTMGSLSDVTFPQLGVLAPAIIIGLLLGFQAVKALNLLLLGETYASTMGLNLRRARQIIFSSTILLAGTVTAYCGPIGFIGLAMPHVSRMLTGTSDHRVLLPATMLVSAATLSACDLIARQWMLPINAITSLIGIPVVAWIVLRNRLN
ncbi:MAG: iron ABC transporter permease [Bacteroides sp.]|nr:iron ABC transporter permease [Bacteroides sp.]